MTHLKWYPVISLAQYQGRVCLRNKCSSLGPLHQTLTLGFQTSPISLSSIIPSTHSCESLACCVQTLHPTFPAFPISSNSSANSKSLFQTQRIVPPHSLALSVTCSFFLTCNMKLCWIDFHFFLVPQTPWTIEACFLYLHTTGLDT